MLKRPQFRKSPLDLLQYMTDIDPDISTLSQAIETLDPSTIIPFPSFDGSRFREILDEEMGFT